MLQENESYLLLEHFLNKSIFVITSYSIHYTKLYEIDDFVANLKLKSLGINIDELTKEQYRYMYGE